MNVERAGQEAGIVNVIPLVNISVYVIDDRNRQRIIVNILDNRLLQSHICLYGIVGGLNQSQELVGFLDGRPPVGVAGKIVNRIYRSRGRWDK